MSGRARSNLTVVVTSCMLAVTVATAVATQTYLSMLAHGHSFFRILIWQLTYWLFWGLAAPLLLNAGAQLVADGGAGRRGWVQIPVLGASLVATHILLAAQCTVWIQPFMPVATHRFMDALLDQTGLLLVVDLLVFALLVLAGSALGVSDRARRLELHESRLEAALTEANLEALRLEIQPHFLFNTLNAIGALIRRGSAPDALAMLVDLGELLRDTLDRRDRHVTTVQSEIAFTRRYVDLYRRRFSDRLDVTYVVDPAALDRRVPTFILQPLVENAFRHGMIRDMCGCHVEIGVRLDMDRLSLWVSDDGAGLVQQGGVMPTGTGLSNVRSRVAGLFGPTARVEIAARESGGTIARVVLPATTMSTL